MTPKPSFAPLLMALGTMCLLWGTVTSWMVSILGAVLVGAATVNWVRQK